MEIKFDDRLTQEERRQLLGYNISRIRKQQKKTQQDFAKAFDVSTRTISNWEHGKGLDIILLIDIAKFLECKFDDFIVGTNISK